MSGIAGAARQSCRAVSECPEFLEVVGLTNSCAQPRRGQTHTSVGDLGTFRTDWCLSNSRSALSLVSNFVEDCGLN